MTARRLAAALGGLSLDAKVVGGIALFNAVALVFSHTTLQLARDDLVWRLFPGAFGPLFLAACFALALAYPLRDLRRGIGFTPRQRWLHLWAIVLVFAVLPTIAAIVLRETGKPYTYVHDGAIMVEEAARKLLDGRNPYVADYLDTPLYYWPMVNNPALYHLTYFPFLFLVTAPFVAAFDRLGLLWDQRYLYLPAYVGAIAAARTLVPATSHRLSLAALVGLDPQLYPFVVEGRNDFFVLVFLFAGVALLARERRTLGTLLIALAGAAKLHALLLLPFVAVYLLATRRPRGPREAWSALWRPGWPAVLLLAATFVPFIVMDPFAIYDDVIQYNAGGAAWSYPISGMGFGALLLALGVIDHPQADFPFAVLEGLVAIPTAAFFLRRLWREPTIASMLVGYAVTLLAFLFFGRYFQGNYLGFILAVAAPALFLRTRAVPVPEAAAPERAAVAATAAE